MTDLPEFDLLRLERVSTTRFRLPVTTALATPFGRMYGGIGVAACAEAAEQATGRPLQWITTQFVGSAVPSENIDIEVTVPAAGKTTTQSHVTCTIDDRTVFTSLCAHTSRAGGDRAHFGAMPDVPSPNDCGVDPFEGAPAGSFLDRIERRLATDDEAGGVGAFADGRVMLWCRVRDGAIGSPATQAFVTDIIPLAVCAALNVRATGISLDHTVRVIDPEPSEWALIELIPDGFHRSTGHGSLRTWSEDGRLLGTAQQSSIIRLEPLDSP